MVLIVFTIGGITKFSTKLNFTAQELLSGESEETLLNKKRKFKIPFSSKAVNNIKQDDSDELSENIEEEYNSGVTETESEVSDNDEEEDFEFQLEEAVRRREMQNDKLAKENNRRAKLLLEKDKEIGLRDNRKSKKPLTEDDVIKKNELTIKRKMHNQRMIEEEKKQTIDKILNESGKKLKEREKKLLEAEKQKELKIQENIKISLTKIKHMYNKNDKILVRFPQGLILPKVLNQKPLSLPVVKCCQVAGCKNIKKYKDPLTKIDYCSVGCYKILKNSRYVN